MASGHLLFLAVHCLERTPKVYCITILFLFMCCSVPIVVAINKCDKYGVNVVSLCQISDPRIACQAYILNLYCFPKWGLDYVLHSELRFCVVLIRSFFFCHLKNQSHICLHLIRAF